MIVSLFGYTDTQLITMIRGGNERERDKALRYFYDNKALRATSNQYVFRFGGSQDDADEVFQEALIIMDNSIRNSQFESRSALKTYLIGICKKKWYTLKRSQKRITLSDDTNMMDSDDFENPEVIMVQEQHKNIVRAVLDNMKSNCKHLLEMSMLEFKMEEIAHEMGFNNIQSAKNAVQRCRDGFRELLEKNDSLMQLLKYEI